MSWGSLALRAGVLASAFGAVAAHAAIIESVTVSNSTGFRMYNGTAPLNDSGGSGNGTMRLPSTTFSAAGAVTKRTEVGISYEGTADTASGSFFFLHNNYCVGSCATASRTEIVFNVVNTGTVDEALRFDSLITPGHLARIGGSAYSRAGFDFTVMQDSRQLYNAIGSVTNGGIAVTTSDGSRFNGLNSIDSNGWTVLDWGATNLNLGLGTLGAGQTTVIRYVADYYSTTSDTCLDLSACSGVQVVFGDPRKNGSGMSRAAFALPSDRDVIDLDYRGFTSTFAVVDAASELPDQPVDMPDRQYGRTFTPLQQAAPAVPEPGTWAMMLVGFGGIGLAMRRRERKVATKLSYV